MRLKVASKVPGLKPRLLLGILGLVFRKDNPTDVLKAVYHKPKYFGNPFLELLNALMRGPSDWTVAERELFATVTSQKNDCPFCELSHAAVFTLALDSPDASAVLADWRTAPIDPKAKAALALVEKMNRDQAAISKADIDAVRATGARDVAIEDAIHIAFCFHIINRMANAFNFHVASKETNLKAGATLLKRGYRL